MLVNIDWCSYNTTWSPGSTSMHARGDVPGECFSLCPACNPSHCALYLDGLINDTALLPPFHIRGWIVMLCTLLMICCNQRKEKYWTKYIINFKCITYNFNIITIIIISNFHFQFILVLIRPIYKSMPNNKLGEISEISQPQFGHLHQYENFPTKVIIIQALIQTWLSYLNKVLTSLQYTSLGW